MASSEGSNSGALAPKELVTVPYEPLKVFTARKKPSIERFLGSSHARFVYGSDFATSSDSSTLRPGTEHGLPSASRSTKTSFSCSTAGGSPTMPQGGEGRRYDYRSTADTSYPKDNAFLGLMTQATETEAVPENASSQVSLAVIKSVPMPQFPIRVFNGKPPPFSLGLQRRRMRWRYDWLDCLEPVCIQDPGIRCIHETARPYIKSVAPEATSISVDLLARGGFNQAYNIIAKNVATGFRQEYIFRVSLPIWPYYKLESDVATTEFVRHATTGIPVPIIYAFDSNPNNELGFEWMLMEKVQGTPLNDVWDTMGFDAKQVLTMKVASWMAELSRLKFSKIGSLFMRYRQRQLEFYIGPTIHEKLFEGDRLLHDVHRGPFQSVQALYDALLEIAERHINDPKHRDRLALRDSTSKEPAIHEEPADPDVTRDTQQPRSDSEESILAQADAEDQKNETQHGISKRLLSWLPEELRDYRIMLPKMCASLPACEPLTTMLTHPDLSLPNIFVDNSGVPIGLIDWERARLEPIAHINVIPKFLGEDGEGDAFYAPSGSVTKEERSAHVYDYDGLASTRGMYESSYRRLMGRIQRTRLRAVYREESKRLQSPMCVAFNRDAESFEQQLIRRVYWPDDSGNSGAAFWAVKYLGESILDEFDDE